jgi:hypothetical protein
MSLSRNRVAGILICSGLGFLACFDGSSSKNNAALSDESPVAETDEALIAAAAANEGTPHVLTRAQVGALPEETWRNLDEPASAAALTRNAAPSDPEDAPDDSLQSPEEPFVDGPLVAEGDDEPLFDPSLDAVNDTENAFPEAP